VEDISGDALRMYADNRSGIVDISQYEGNSSI
jgi:hypothetical protein